MTDSLGNLRWKSFFVSKRALHNKGFRLWGLAMRWIDAPDGKGVYITKAGETNKQYLPYHSSRSSLDCLRCLLRWFGSQTNSFPPSNTPQTLAAPVRGSSKRPAIRGVEGFTWCKGTSAYCNLSAGSGLLAESRGP